MNRSLGIAVGMFAALAAPRLEAVEVYKWVDAKGKVHYGDRPEGGQQKKLDIKVDAPARDDTATARDERTRKLLDQYAAEREEAAEDKARKAEEDAKRKKNCRLAKDILDEYRNASYLYDKDENGKRLILTEEQRAKAEAEAQKAVDTWCKPAP